MSKRNALLIDLVGYYYAWGAKCISSSPVMSDIAMHMCEIIVDMMWVYTQQQKENV